MPRKPIPEEFLTEKQKKEREYRKKSKKYAQKYAKYYYLKKLLEDKEYNKKRKQREKELKLTKNNSST